MAALFYEFSEKDIFKTKLGSNANLVKIDFLDGFVGAKTVAIMTDIQIRNSETVQTFLSFDDFIHYCYFGKGLGSIGISGIMLMDCEGEAPGLSELYGRIQKKRGEEVVVSIANHFFAGILTDFGVDISSEPQTTFTYSLNIAVVRSSFLTPNLKAIGC